MKRTKHALQMDFCHTTGRSAQFLVLVLFLLVTCVVGQSLPGLTQSPPSTPAAPTDPLGRSNPAGTVFAFLQAAQAGNSRTAAEYLQMSAARRQSQGPNLAAELKVLMDRAFVGNLRRISTRPEGGEDSSGKVDQQTIGTFSSGDIDVPVVLVRITDANVGKIWLFSADTLSKVPDLYDNLQSHQIETHLPAALVQHAVFGLSLWQWLALLAAIPVAAGLGWVVVLALAVPRKLWLKIRHRPNLHSYSQMTLPLLVFFAAIIHRIYAGYLGLPLLPRTYYYRVIGVVIEIGFFWLLLRLTTITMQRFRMRAIRDGRAAAGTLALLGERLLKVAIVGVAILGILGTLGFNLTTVLAGLGIGGIAIAFAAQKTLENLFGGVSVLADEVIRVGDYCRFGDRTGTVEDISLRSTSVRLDNRIVLSIPNGSLSTMNVENFTRRDKILFNPVLNIRLETTADQMRFLLAELRRLLYEHPRLENETARVRLAGFDNNALNLEFMAFVLTRDAVEFFAIREDLLLRILEIVTQSGTAIARASYTVQLGRDPGLDRERTAAAEQQVGRWRDERQLPFPDFAPEEKSALRGVLSYPPAGSALGEGRP